MVDQPRWPRGAPDDEHGHGQGGRWVGALSAAMGAAVDPAHIPFRVEHSSRGSYTPRWIPGGEQQPTQYYHSYHASTPEGEPAGRMDFSTISYPEGDHEVHVEWVESSFKGAASAMMDRLYAEHPDYQIYHGYQTDDGAPFIERWLRSHPEHASRSHFGES